MGRKFYGAEVEYFFKKIDTTLQVTLDVKCNFKHKSICIIKQKYCIKIRTCIHGHTGGQTQWLTHTYIHSQAKYTSIGEYAEVETF